MYLVTGCAGFIGFHFCKQLFKANVKVIGIDNLNSYYSRKYKQSRLKLLQKNKNFIFYKFDLNNESKLKKIFEQNKIKSVIHLAAQPGVIYSYSNPHSYTHNNVKATIALIDIVKKFKVKKFVFCSSSSVYGDQKKFPIKETFNRKPINYYAKTKIECEKIILKKFNNSKISVSIIRPFTVYGPYGRPDMLILKILKNNFYKKNLNIFDFGKHKRDFTYVEDVAKIIFKISKIFNKKINILNICSSNPVSVNYILEILKKKIKFKSKVFYFPKRKGEMQVTYGSNKNLLKNIKKFKFTSINTGLNNTINWFENFKNKEFLKIHK